MSRSVLLGCSNVMLDFHCLLTWTHTPNQVVLEMVELREVDTARAMLRQTQVFNRMKQEEPDRFLKLEHLCGRTYFDIRCAISVVVVTVNVAGELMVSCCNVHARVLVLAFSAYLHGWPSVYPLCKILSHSWHLGLL